jgi:hypothetical protein
MFLITFLKPFGMLFLNCMHFMDLSSYHKPKGDCFREDKPPINVWYNDRCREAKRDGTHKVLIHMVEDQRPHSLVHPSCPMVHQQHDACSPSL